MGKKLHVVKKQREYGVQGYFNWEYGKFMDILSGLGCYVAQEDENYDFFEIPLKDYENAMSILKQWKDNKEISIEEMEPYYGEQVYFDLDSVKTKMDAIKLDLDPLLKIMEDFYEERDKDSNWIQFEAW